MDSLHRYVKNAKLDKDQHSGYTESHKDVQCLEVEGAENGQRRKRMWVGGREGRGKKNRNKKREYGNIKHVDTVESSHLTATLRHLLHTCDCLTIGHRQKFNRLVSLSLIAS